MSDSQRVDPPPAEAEVSDPDECFCCPTCLEVFVDPVTVVPCGHSFCCMVRQHG